MRTFLTHIRAAPVLAAMGIVLAVISLVLGVRQAGWLQRLELRAYDFSMRLRPVLPADQRLVLVTITEADIRRQGRWPMTDETLARAMKLLSDSGPRAIGLDIYRDIEVPPGRALLDAALRHPAIVAVTKVGGEEENVPPPSALRGTDQVGFNDLVMDRDGTLRRLLLFLEDEGQTLFSFPLRLALLYLRAEGIQPQPDPEHPELLRLGQVTLTPFTGDDGGYVGADARGYQLLLDYRHEESALRAYTLTDVLDGRVGPEVLQDKIVLVGSTAISVHDSFDTPLSTGREQVHRAMHGVFVHANAVSQLLRAGLGAQPPMRTWGGRSEALWIICWALLGGVLGWFVRSVVWFSVLASVGTLALASAVQWTFVRGWWIPFVPPGLAGLASASLVTAYMSSQEKEQRQLLMRLFSKHVSPEVAETIWQNRDRFFDGGRLRSQQMPITVLFTDVKGYTSVSEKLDPSQLIDWLNVYMEAMANQVILHGGVIDDYAGDAIKADFGVPIPRTAESEIGRDAVNAVECALGMQAELATLNGRLMAQGLKPVGMRVGIYSGMVVAGSLGSSERLKYTTIGDTVNIASRLESFDKESFERNWHIQPCRILIGEATLKLLDDRYEVERVGDTSLKGKDDKIVIYRVVGRKGDGPRLAQEVTA